MTPSPSPSLPDWLHLNQQVAVVTGGGTHLGLAMSRALCELGATVYLVGRRPAVVWQAALKMQQEGLQASSYAADAANPAEMQAVLDQIIHRHARLDIMLCNAGGGQGADIAPQISVTDFEATLRNNLTSTLVCAQTAAHHMITRGQGRIITIGSIHGGLGSDPRLYGPDFKRSSQSYHAAKGGIVNLTRALACEWAQHGITVNCISPGQIPKPGIDPITQARFLQQVPLGRLGVPSDLNGAVALLASPAGGWITGQNLIVDGGWSVW